MAGRVAEAGKADRRSITTKVVLPLNLPYDMAEIEVGAWQEVAGGLLVIEACSPFAGLNNDLGIWEIAQVARMVKVQVRQDRISDAYRIDI